MRWPQVGRSRWTWVALVMTVAAISAASCGAGQGGSSTVPTVPVTTTIIPTATPTGTATAAPTAIRVAFIDLLGPVGLDSTNTQAADTYGARLALVIKELRAFRPDIVGFNDVTNTKAHGDTGEALAAALKMESQSIRANPWFPGQTQAQNDAIARQIGFEEGDMILSRYPILKADRLWINPRTSETEGRAALHVVVKGPPSTGDIDVYITHFTGGGDQIRAAQAASVVAWIGKTRGSGPVIVMGDLSDGPGSPAYAAFTAAGLTDLAMAKGSGQQAVTPANTCCRASVAGMQPPLTTRTDYLFAAGWAAGGVSTFAGQPEPQPGGSLLYASNHDGLTAVFPVGMLKSP